MCCLKVSAWITTIGLAGCLIREPNWRRVESTTQDWVIPRGERIMISPPLLMEHVDTWVEKHQGEGWRLRECEPIDTHHLPQKVVLVMTRPEG